MSLKEMALTSAPRSRFALMRIPLSVFLKWIRAAWMFCAPPAISLPIFDAGKLRADYAVSTADLDSAVADYNGALTGAVQQTADALTQIRSLDRQAAEQQNLLADTDQGYRMAQTRYRTGLANQLTVFNAETTFLQAREQEVSLAADDVTQRVTLLLALGGGFDPKNPAPTRAQANIPQDNTP